MKRLSERIQDFILKSVSSMSEEYIDIFKYGFQIKCTKSLHLVIMLCISLFYMQLCEGVVFIMLYSQLRKNAGGFHAKSKGKCLIYSVLVMNCAMILVKKSKEADDSMCFLIGVIIILITGVGILILSPVDCYNKPLCADEYSIQKSKVAKSIVFALLFYFVGGIYIKSLRSVVISAFVIQLIFMIMGCKKSPRYRRKR